MPLLSLIVWHSAIGAVLLMFLNPSDEKRVWKVGLGVSIIGLLLSLKLYFDFNAFESGMQFTEKLTWIPLIGANYQLAVDGIAVALIVLTALTTMIICLMARHLVSSNLRDYLAVFLMMQTMVMGVFCAQDALLFYFFWEGSLIPMYLCIGIWGSKDRAFAAKKFFIYTFFGSTLLLVAIAYLGMLAGSFEMSKLAQLSLGFHEQLYLFIAFLLAFAIKVPMFPVHTWLPDAHTEAPTGGSVLLAALLLKVGGYGFVRFSLPMTPDAASYLAIPMIILSLIAIVYVGLIALAQDDMKRLIAYSSVAHMGFVTLGMFGIYLIPTDMQALAFNGAMVQMISHAFGSGAMFLAFGMIYQRLHTRLIDDFGGLAKHMPYLAAFFMIFSFANIGVPGTSGFVGELMVIIAFMKSHAWISALSALTLVVAASYTLWMYRRVFFGPVRHERVSSASDIIPLEHAVLWIFVICIFALGLYPRPLTDLMEKGSHQVISSATITKIGSAS